jgi:predicted  nucleic acid-binding Zn-ribbon protein
MNGLEDRISRLEESINALRERVARIEGIVEQMDKRLNHIETELREFRGEVNERFEGLRKEIFGEISSLRRELNTGFYWLIGILITMWITITLTILFKAH